jgi:hypothetical protein
LTGKVAEVADLAAILVGRTPEKLGPNNSSSLGMTVTMASAFFGHEVLLRGAI